MIEKNLQLLEQTVIDYCRSKAQYLEISLTLDFSFLSQVHRSIKQLPMDNEKVKLMQRFQDNIFKQIVGYHPKIACRFNFASDIKQFALLIQTIDQFESNAKDLNSHFSIERKSQFDWQGLIMLRTQINDLTDRITRRQLMSLFESQVLSTVYMLDNHVYSQLTFKSELESEDEKSLSPYLC